MAWLDLKGWSEQLSSVATNAADFTRDVLAEGTSEVSDHETELKITENKVDRLESIIASLKAENERLADNNSELKDNADTSELQINTISSQYRSMVQEKEDEIKLLKEKQNDWQNFQSENLMVSSSPTALATSTSTSSLSSSALQVPGDHDINDLIGAQQEINTLSSELARSQAQCEHWRQIASSRQQPQFEVGEEETHIETDEALSVRIKELESRLRKEIDESQHELSALQDVHSQKLTNLKKAHQSQIDKYKDRLEQLEEELSLGQEADSEGATTTQKDSGGGDKIRERLTQVQEDLERTREELQESEGVNAGLQDEIRKLRLKERQNLKQCSELESRVEEMLRDKEAWSAEREEQERRSQEQERQRQKQERTIEELRGGASSQGEIDELRKLLEAREKELEEVRSATVQVSSELLATKHRLLASLDDNHASASAMLREVQSTRRKVVSDSDTLKRQLFHEKQDLVKEMIEIGKKVNQGQSSIEDLEVISQEVQDETVDLINKMGRTDAHDALEETGRLADQVSRLQSQLDDLNTTCESLASDKQHSESVIARLNGDISMLRRSKSLPPEGSLRSKVDGGLLERPQDPQLAIVDVQSDTQSFDGEFDDSLMFASIKQKYPEAASAMEEQLLQYEEIQKDWEMEKGALEQVLMSVKKQLRETEQELQEIKGNQTEDMSATLTEEMESRVADLRSQLEVAESSEVRVKKNLEVAVKEKERLMEELSQLRDETEQLTSRVVDSEKQKALFKQQLDDSQLDLEKLNERLDQTTQELEEKNRSVLDISQMKDDLEQDLQQLDEQQDQALSKILESKGQIQAELDSTKQENERLQRELDARDGMMDEIERLKLELKQGDNILKENESLKEDLGKREEISDELKEKLEEMSKEVESLKYELEQKEVVIDEMVHLKQELDKVQGMPEEVERLRAEVEDRSGMEDEIASLKKELTKREGISERIESLERELSERGRESRERVTLGDSNQPKVLELERALAKKSKEVEMVEREKEREIEELKQEVDVQKESYERLNESHTILQKCNKLLEDEKTALKKSLKGKGGEGDKEVREVLDRMEEECADLRAHSEKVQGKCSEIEATLARTQHEKMTLRRELTRKNNDVDTLKERLTEAEESVKLAEDAAKVTQDEKAGLEQQMEELNESMDVQSKHHQQALMGTAGREEELESEAVQLEREVHLKEMKIKEEEMEELRGRYEELLLDLSGTKEALNTTVSNHEQLTVLLDEKETDIKSLADENAFFLDAMNEAKEKEKELKITREKAAEFEEQVEMLSGKKSELERRVLELEEMNVTNSDESKTLGLITDLEFEISDLQTCLKEKDMTISKLNEDLESIRKQGETALRAKEEELMSKQEIVTAMENENTTLGRKNASLEDQLTGNLDNSETGGDILDAVNERLNKKTEECQMMELKMQNLETKLKAVQQELSEKVASDQDLATQIDDLQEELDIYDESLKTSREKRTLQESKISSLLQEIGDKEAEISQLSSEKEAMTRSVSEKESKTKQLQEEVDNLKNFVQSNDNGAPITGSESFGDLEPISGIHDSNVVTVQSNLRSEPLAISDSEKQLEKMVQEREREIASLKDQNQAAMKLLDDKSRTIMGNSVLVDLHKLQMQKKTLESERHQMVTVLNGKTRECSNLKTEVHKLMKIVSAEKAALEKAQEDFKDLQKSLQRPRNEMQKEALQNLSYLIQEKDLEIGALRQKNETLVQVLQEASPNKSTEINDVLEGKERLEKENKMLKEERDQLVVSIHQKHHESVTYYEEVQRLAGVVSQESQKYIELQKKFDGLFAEREEQQKSLVEVTAQLEERGNVVGELERKLEFHQQRFSDMELQLANLNKSCLSSEKEREQLQEKLHKQGGCSEVNPAESSGPQEEEVRKLRLEIEMLRTKPVEEVFTQRESPQLDTMLKEKLDLEQKCTVDHCDGLSSKPEINLESEMLAKDKLIKDLQSEMENLEMTLEDRNERVNQKTNESLQKESEAVILRQQVDIQNQSLLDHEKVVQEKEQLVHYLKQQCLEKDKAAGLLVNQVKNQSQRMAPLESDLKTAKEEARSLHHSVVKKDAENRSLQDMSNSLSMQIRERDFELGALREKNKTLTQLVKEREAGSQGDVERMLRETEAMQRQAQMFQQERDQAVLLLQKNDADMAGLKREIQDKSNQEKKLNSELQRLRNHLIEMEDSYMSEALQAEEREKQLRDRLTHTEENLRTNSTAVQSASQSASNQIENLLDQLASATNEKDQILLELAASQEQCQQYSTALQNLQMVLEQFQQEKNEMVAQEVEIYQKRAEEKEKIAEHLFKQNMEVQQRLSDTQDALESASRLTEQLDRKEESIARLRDEISRRDEELNKYKRQFEEVANAAETKVDKPLVKNLFINYVNAPAAKKDEVTHLITSLLNFSKEELDRLSGRTSGGWLSGIFGGARPAVSPPSTPRASGNPHEKSFSQQFVKFLEEESTPSIKLRLPVEEMAKERSKPPAFNPFSAPVPSQSPFIPSSPPAKGLGAVGPPSSSSSSQLMINPVPMKPSVPQPAITPVPPREGGSGRNSPASARGSLRDVLQ